MINRINLLVLHSRTDYAIYTVLNGIGMEQPIATHEIESCVKHDPLVSWITDFSSKYYSINLYLEQYNRQFGLSVQHTNIKYSFDPVVSSQFQ